MKNWKFNHLIVLLNLASLGAFGAEHLLKELPTEQVHALDAKLLELKQSNQAMSAMPDRQSILEAVKKLNGNAVVDLGNGKLTSDRVVRFKNSAHSSTVIIGSGSNGLVATDNHAVGTPVVVETPNNIIGGISVTGRMPNTRREFCVFEYSGDITNPDSPRSVKQLDCADIGSEILLKPGNYLLSFEVKAPGLLYERNFNLMKIEITSGEHKIIPLREIVVKNGQPNIAYFIEVDYKDNPEALANLCTALTDRLDSFHYLTPDLISVKDDGSLLGNIRGDGLYTFSGIPGFAPESSLLNGNSFKDPIAEVLPGQYRIIWYTGSPLHIHILDSQRGIVVE